MMPITLIMNRRNTKWMKPFNVIIQNWTKNIQNK